MEDTIQKINKENLYTGFKVLLRYLGQYKRNIFILMQPLLFLTD